MQLVQIRLYGVVKQVARKIISLSPYIFYLEKQLLATIFIYFQGLISDNLQLDLARQRR